MFSLRHILKKDRTRDSGQTLVEFAISATVFFLLIFATLDFGFLFFAKVTLQNAVRQAGRYAITGNCGSGGSCFGTGGNRLPIIIQTVTDYSFFLSPAITVACVSGTCPGYSGGTGGNAGGPDDFVQITATYVWHPFLLSRFFTGGSYTLTVSSTFKNESFAPPSS
jgi:hypothetical protein